MRTSIGFDRDIKLEWLDAVATQVSAGRTTKEVRNSIHKMLGASTDGKPNAAIVKTTTVLLHVWSQVPDDAVGLRDRIAAIFPDLNPEERIAAHWSMCIATYPFFLDVAVTVGRLMSLQGEVSLTSLKRRLAERWGDRALMPQAARKVVRSMVEWKALRDLKRGLYTYRERAIEVGTIASGLLVEAILVGSRQRSLPISDLERHPALFAFRVTASVGVLRAAKQLAVHRQGVDMEVVELASAENKRVTTL